VSTPRISVLIDAYNYGRYIEEAIASVVGQDFAPEEMEILVVDDGSTDDTRERVGKYAERVKYVYKENGGQASAFNRGIAEARGELIFLLDADDYWRPGKVRRIAGLFAEHPEVGMIYHRYAEREESSGRMAEQVDPVISGNLAERKRDLISYWIYPTSTLAFRRGAVQGLLPVPEGLKIQADAYLAALAIFQGPVLGVEESLAVYRVHGGNLFHTSGAADETERLRRRMATREIFIEEITGWLRRSGREVEREPVRSYLARWRLAQEADGFRLRAPGRMKIFGHLLKYPIYFGARMSWRQRWAEYADAAGALCLGYGRYRWVGELRRKVKGKLAGRRAESM